MSLRRTVVSIAAVAAVAASAAAAAPAPAAEAAVFVPTQVTGFTWMSGLDQWRQPNLSRLARSAWRFDRNGFFAMGQPDGYPLLQGSWRRRGNRAVFFGSYRFDSGYSGSTVTQVAGTMSLRGRRTIRLRLAAGQTLNAVLNCYDGTSASCTRYYGNRVKAYSASVRVRRAG